VNLYQVYCNDLGSEHLHLVAAEGAAEAVRAFVADYRGVHSDEVVSHRIVDCMILVAAEEVNGRHMQVEWDIQEIEVKAGVLF